MEVQVQRTLRHAEAEQSQFPGNTIRMRRSTRGACAIALVLMAVWIAWNYIRAVAAQ